MKMRYFAGHFAPFLSTGRKIRSLYDNSGYVRVLIYHDISESKLGLFSRQIHYLASHYQFLTPEQFQRFTQGEYYISGANLLITFDDGFKSNRLVAEKVLGPMGIKGIFFVTTEFIGQPDRTVQREFIEHQIFDGDISGSEILSGMEPLTWDDLEYLLEQGHVIGSHTCNHKRLSKVHSQNDLHYEIIESGNILEKKLGVTIDCFAYPFGDIDSICNGPVNLIKQRYKYSFSGIRGSNYSSVFPYAILRDAISVNDPPGYLRLIIENGIDIFYRKKASRLLKITRGY
ncbi:Polysaccharide deacetylase [uncultured archaeon]|nr:Polysaccharide deacetylase [uncultured archaeon]